MPIPVWILIPFALQLLCVAVLPLTRAAEWWEKNTHKLIVSLILGTPVAVWLCMGGLTHELEHQMVYDYVPFVLLLMALFVTTGGLCIRGNFRATPWVNAAILAIGFLLASFVGTTGAAMVLIRLLIATNKERKYTTHTILFFIAMVANCGGILTPLGDPPLFLLFQAGAPFGWFSGMWLEWAFTGALLLWLYLVMDTIYYQMEDEENLEADRKAEVGFRMTGLINIVWLLCVVASTMFINSTYIPAMGAEDASFFVRFLREWAFILIILASLLTTPRQARRDNNFSFTPIMEVACVFLGIFATMTPALLFLREHPIPVTQPWQYVYATGALSAFLDNAPTAMVFHATATGLKYTAGTALVAGVGDIYLRAICMGAVFFGALTYIGNGPNFMVKSIAEENGMRMPSFFAYIGKFSLIILPVYIIVQLVFIR